MIYLMCIKFYKSVKNAYYNPSNELTFTEFKPIHVVYHLEKGKKKNIWKNFSLLFLKAQSCLCRWLSSVLFTIVGGRIVSEGTLLTAFLIFLPYHIHKRGEQNSLSTSQYKGLQFIISTNCNISNVLLVKWSDSGKHNWTPLSLQKPNFIAELLCWSISHWSSTMAMDQSRSSPELLC